MPADTGAALRLQICYVRLSLLQETLRPPVPAGQSHEEEEEEDFYMLMPDNKSDHMQTCLTVKNLPQARVIVSVKAVQMGELCSMQGSVIGGRIEST